MSFADLPTLPIDLMICDRCGTTIRDEDGYETTPAIVGHSRISTHTDLVLCSLLASELGDPNNFDMGDYGPRVPTPTEAYA